MSFIVRIYGKRGRNQEGRVTDQEPKRCPCCRRSAVGWISKTDWDGCPQAYRIECILCSLNVEIERILSGLDTIEECKMVAFEVWNIRPENESSGDEK